MPIIPGGVSVTLWSTNTRKIITTTCAMIAAMGGAVGAIKAEASDIEYVWFAHRGYVRSYSDQEAKAEAKKINEEIEEKIKKWQTAQAEVQRSTYHIRRELADDKMERTENDLFKTQRDLKAAQHEYDKAIDPQTKQFIEGQVDDLTRHIGTLTATKQKIEKAIETLDKTKGAD